MRKSISLKLRHTLHDKYNHKCAYCGCDLEYKDMQVDHIQSIYINELHGKNENINSEENLLPACRQCNFYKSTTSIEGLRENLTGTMMRNLEKNFNFRLALKYGLVEVIPKKIVFYFETMKE